ncbi:MAG TPA: helicase-associated domain-containing protein, partial [Spirochaetales bacterium]|nr:helicase-associated domain-containing protein [Spirochaetales bacterium]
MPWYKDRMPESKPLIAQSDQSLLLDAHDPAFDAARAELSAFATLEKSPEHFHSFRMDALSLWNAASAGLGPDAVIAILRRWSKYDLPPSMDRFVSETMSRFGRLVMRAGSSDTRLVLSCDDPFVRAEVEGSRKLGKLLDAHPDGWELALVDRGTVKRELIHIGWPVLDEAPLVDGDPFPLSLKNHRTGGQEFCLRAYQEDGVRAFTGQGKPGTGYGVVVMPCGAGKTVVGMATMAAIGRKTLIITTNVAAVHQWMDELLDKSDIRPEDLGEYTGTKKEVKSVTVATYQVLTWRPDKTADFPHFELFRREKWGLIIYDE